MARPSMINTILLYLSLVGIGAIGGYGMFYFLFSERCSGLIAERDIKHNAAFQVLQSKYDKATENQKQCDGSAMDEKKLKKRQEDHDALNDRHHTLLDKHEETLRRLSEANTVQETATNTIAELREELAQKKLSLESTNRKLHETEKSKELLGIQLATQLDTLRKKMKNTDKQVEVQLTHLEACKRVLTPVRKELQYIKEYIRARHHVQSQNRYGSGPFIVEFILQFPATMNPDEGPRSFRVELSPLPEMPHTVTVFLDLVTMQLYDGTAFVAANDEVLEGGAPTTALSDRSVELFQKYSKIGHRRSPLAFNEYSHDTPHDMFTISFIGSPVAGPSLAFNLRNNSEERGPNADGIGGTPAFGRVVEGRDTLERIQNAPRAADGYRFALDVRIESVRLVSTGDSDDDHEREEL